ncbi:MAG: Lipid-A-disaccharide synthase [Verrucomicrobiales bacterium]|nr:Lipid-A-disaccharide synthase [Verrucomicrobiales bacterium]
MFIAGEASGDTLGAELAKVIKSKRPNAQFFGAAGPRMAAQGVDLAFDLTEHAVVGIVEVLKNYSKFKGFFDRLLTLAVERKPDAIILIDYPGFNLRFAEAVKKRSATISDWKPKVVFYVSPQIWAWHESRIHQIARDIDLLLTIFPFEKGWYRARKPELHVEFVGHPIVDRHARFKAGKPQPLEEPTSPEPLILLLPGSRIRELKKHLPPMIDAVRNIRRQRKAQFKMVLPSHSLAELAQSYVSSDNSIEIATSDLPESLARASLAIASSGTVTMECAYFGVPTIVLYRTSFSTHFLGRRFIKVKYLAMPNLLADEMIYPEFIQSAATADNISRKAIELLNNTEGRRVIKAKLLKVIESLGPGGASERAADAILHLIAK